MLLLYKCKKKRISCRQVNKNLGILVIEYLKNNFSQILNYKYTQSMEEKLDLIANNSESYFNLLNNCNKELDEVISGITIEKHKFKIDNNHTFLIGKNGPVIKKVENENIEFLSIKDNININYLKENHGNYEIEDLIDHKKMKEIVDAKKENIIGYFNNYPIFLKKGKYGQYLEHNKKNYSLPKQSKFEKFKEKTNETKSKITLEESINLIKNYEINKEDLRILNSNLSLRNGKFGYYLMNKTKNMRKPEFYSLKDCELNIKLCDDSSIINWVNEKFKTDF